MTTDLRIIHLELTKHEKCDLPADYHIMFHKWENQIYQMLGVNNVSETQKHITAPLVPQPSTSEVENATKKLKSKH